MHHAPRLCMPHAPRPLYAPACNRGRDHGHGIGTHEEGKAMSPCHLSSSCDPPHVHDMHHISQSSNVHRPQWHPPAKPVGPRQPVGARHPRYQCKGQQHTIFAAAATTCAHAHLLVLAVVIIAGPVGLLRRGLLAAPPQRERPQCRLRAEAPHTASAFRPRI